VAQAGKLVVSVGHGTAKLAYSVGDERRAFSRPSVR
jgi:hypothetical protein